MNADQPTLLRTSALGLYSLALNLYPRAFRERYRDELMHAAWNEMNQSSDGFRTLLKLIADTLTSALREHWRSATGPSPGFVLLFVLFFSTLLVGVSVFHQQVVRRAADLAPEQIARLIVRNAPSGSTSIIFAPPSPQLPTDPAIEKYRSTHAATGAVLISGPTKELDSPAFLNSTDAFVAIYDTSGHPIASNATLDGVLPQPPRGIFKTILSRGKFKVSWQPRTGLRIALTGLPLPTGGYVLAGQSLVPGEARTAAFGNFLLFLWAALLVATIVIFMLLRAHKLRKL